MEINKKCCGKCNLYNLDGGSSCERFLICDEECSCESFQFGKHISDKCTKRFCEECASEKIDKEVLKNT